MHSEMPFWAGLGRGRVLSPGFMPVVAQAERHFLEQEKAPSMID